MRTFVLIVALVSALSTTAQSSTVSAFTEGAWNGDQFSQSTNGRVTLFPNPASDQVSVAFPGLTGEVIVSVIDASGRVMKMEQVNQATGQLYLIDVQDLPDGAYIVNVEQEDQRTSERLIVAH